MSLSSENLDGLFEKISLLKVFVVGDVMLDHYIWGDSSRISPEAPVPIVHVGSDSYALGGAANVAMNIRTLGANASLAGSWASDENGRILEKTLGEGGVDFNKSETSEGGPTIVKTRVMSRRQQVCRVDREASPKSYSVENERFIEEIRLGIRDSDAVIISDYSKGVVVPALAQLVMEESIREDTFVALDSKSGLLLGIEGVDLATPNRSEALNMAGEKIALGEAFPAEVACREIWNSLRPNYLVITLGEGGMLVSENGEVREQIPTAAREVYDVSGAGDTVIASLTLALVAGASISEAARFANLAAGVVVGKVGTAQAAPEEVMTYAAGL